MTCSDVMLSLTAQSSAVILLTPDNELLSAAISLICIYITGFVFVFVILSSA